MELIPAIDLLGGKVVRLHQGKYDEVTVYSDDPSAMARDFEAHGARRLHVVDLDGARSGKPGNVSAIQAILAATKLEVQVGGGVRTAETAVRWLDAGAKRVVMGTAAIKNPAIPKALCADHPGSVIIAIDARGGEVAVEGWLEASGKQATELARDVDTWGVSGILFTNIDRDGTRVGPDVEGTAALQGLVGVTVIASGGIGSLEHLAALREAGVRATVCGKALYSGAFTLEQAFAVSEGR